MFGLIWRALSTATTIYILSKQLETMNSMKNDIYETLNEDQQAKWQSIFGDPNAELNLPFQIPQVKIPELSDLSKLESGT